MHVSRIHDSYKHLITLCSSHSEFPKWLAELSMTPTIWDGVILSSKVAEQYNTLIKSKKATLLDLRNYIFLRQCKLLIKMKRKWEIPSRLLEFLFAVIHEFRLLDVRIFSIKKFRVLFWSSEIGF